MKDDGISFRIIGLGPVAGNMQAVSDLDAVTTYFIQVMVRNDQGFQANTTITYTTGELGESDIW